MTEFVSRWQTTRVASVNLDANQYTFVSLANVGNTGKLSTVAAAGGLPFGILQNKPKAGEHGAVVFHGSSKIRLSNSYGPGLMIMSAVSGFATAALSGSIAVGQLVTGATSGAVGEIHYFGYSFTGSL